MKKNKNNDKIILTKSFGGVINHVNKGPISSIFQKESDEIVEKRKFMGSNPINMEKRKLKLISKKPYNLKEHPILSHPKRPDWNASLDKITHESNEQRYFDNWCSNIINFFSTNQQTKDYIVPFENNIDVWRQLWRTIEQSDVILLVVDIRNPLLHIPPSLVDDIINNHKKKVVVILTKIDLVSKDYTNNWIKYLKAEFPEIEDFLPFTKQPIDDDIDASKGGVTSRRRRLKKKPKKDNQIVKKMVDNIIKTCVKGFTLDKKPSDEKPGIKREAIVTIGCLGHPNCGKSSVLNSIIGEKVLSVSRTAGHTKHIQHIFLTEPYGVCVMDCPGLIFPINQPRYIFELSGLYPIAQIRETMTAINFLMENIELERLYNIKLPDWAEEWSALTFCEALGDKKGYTLSKGGGAIDIHRVGLEIIRDCVDGIICLSFQPPIDIL